jgi:hypothetical protein
VATPALSTIQTAAQRGVAGRPGDARDLLIDDRPENQVQLDPPGPEVYFRLESEASFFERLKQRGYDQRKSPYDPNPDLFPDEKVISTDTYAGRQWPALPMLVEPAYVCHKRLLFEQRNEERYGWDLGAIQPFVSLAHFWGDAAMLPYHIASRPTCKHECSAGWCLPGDPVPYSLYPPEISCSGSFVEAATIIGLFVLFP